MGTAQDGCIEDFENNSEFSQKYQASQNCMCDTEHMFACPRQNSRAEGFPSLGVSLLLRRTHSLREPSCPLRRRREWATRSSGFATWGHHRHDQVEDGRLCFKSSLFPFSARRTRVGK